MISFGLISEWDESEVDMEELIIRVCDICGKSSSTRWHLHRHRMSHTGEKKFSCHTCLRAFARKDVLMGHMLSHTGQKDFKCQHCDKCFSRKTNMRAHIWVKHKQ